MAHAYSVEVELPAEAFRHTTWSPVAVAADLRRLWLVEQVRQRRLGYAKAAELAGVHQAEFVRILGEHHVSVFDLDADELDAELTTAAELGRR